MEPFGFAHLQRQNAHLPSSWRISDRGRKRFKNIREEIRPNKAQTVSFKRLYYPVNTPACYYQKQLVVDSLFHNVLIALPKELDSFFVASVVMINFRRWFPNKKVIYVGSTVDMVRRMADVFVDLTGYTKSDICIYSAKKKCDRFTEWCSCGVVFVTAEMLLPDMKDGSIGSDVNLVVVDDAQRAASGSHPVCEMIRTFILNKGNFRILALTDNRITKVAPLQLIVMNLQIGLIRTQSRFSEDIPLTISSPHMQEIYVSITPEMENIANGLVEAMGRLVSLLYESGVVPSDSLQQLANYSRSSMRKNVECKASHLTDVFSDLEDLFIVYDALMCDGITVFSFVAQPKAKRSPTIQNIIESNVYIKEAFLQPDMSNSNEICSHKLPTLLNLFDKTLNKYGSELSRGQKVVAVVLCRNRGPLFIRAIAATLRKRFTSAKAKANIIIYEKGTRAAQNFSERSLISGSCNIIIYMCDSSAVELNIGFVDLLICCDEGLSSLYYTGKISLRNEAELYALRTSGYETNICHFTSEESLKECIDTKTIKGAQLCTDNPQLFPDIIPEIVEYWSTEANDDSGTLSTLDRLAFEERLDYDGGKDIYKDVIKSTRMLLSVSMDEALLWQDRPQRIVETAHSTATFTLTKLVSADQHAIYEQIEKVRQRALNEEKWLDEGYPSETSTCNSEQQSNANRHTSEVMDPPARRAKRARPSAAPPVLRIDSASFRLLNKKPPQLSAKSFVNRIAETTEYRERQERMADVIDKLRKLLRI